MSSANQPLIIKTIDEARECVSQWHREGDTIAFVPTMGNLHAGHLSLVEAASAKASRIVVSIFVNPLQFGENEDFDDYPRTFDEDITKLSIFNVDMVFAPTQDVIYPENRDNASVVEVPVYSSILEGECRPGFFRGVATVVNKLFNIIQPDVAVFGEKDYQQLKVIEKMVHDLAIPVSIHSVATVRESDGLAMSSRNSYLDDDRRMLAASLQKCLRRLVESVQNGENANYEVGHASRHLDQMGFIVDYVVVRRQKDLAVPETGDRSLVVLAAARLGDVRLIDNIPFELTV